MAKAVQAEAPKKQKSSSYEIVQQFHDVADFDKVFEVGDDFSHSNEARVKELIEAGLIKEK